MDGSRKIASRDFVAYTIRRGAADRRLAADREEMLKIVPAQHGRTYAFTHT
jgi:hypothetical protein